MYYHHRLSQFSTQSYGPFGLADTANTDSGLKTPQNHQHSPSSHAGYIIGQPIPFVSGQFAGNTVRAELVEIQKADLGRKYARVDRRPLDPPPVVALRLFHVTEPDSEERELPNETIQVLGLVCTVDLFPVPESRNNTNTPSPNRTSPIPFQPATRNGQERRNSGSLWNPSPSRSPDSIYASHNAYSSPPQENGAGDSAMNHYIEQGYGENYLMVNTNLTSAHPAESANHYLHHRQLSEYPAQSPSYQHAAEASPSSPTPSYNHQSQYGPPALQNQTETPGSISSSQAGQRPQQIIHYVDGIPIIEGTQMTHALVGAKFVQPTPVDWNGQKRLMFVFSDLAVKIEGLFILRYRIFDIFSRADGHRDLVVQAECYGGPFKVYSTKEFPGLQASTELTKLIARYGVRLNIRETERRRRKKNGVLVSGAGKGKRKRSSDDEEEDDEVDGDDD
ncbi:hypothetical protein L218DRAFT_953092 [Marasmius fiardii PR-910]|nr:hypothetical protein L218DRAFT_953092 [Marasmius fiardii PR-910]